MACQVKDNATSMKVPSTNVAEEEVKANKLPQRTIGQKIEVAWKHNVQG